MPRVSVEKSRGPQISEAPIRGGQFNVQTSEETFGGGVALKETANALQNTVSTLQKVEVLRRKEVADEAARQKKIADTIAAQEGDLFLSKKQTDIMQTVKGMKGKDSGGSVDYANEEWKKAVEEYRSTLQNPEQIQSFNNSATTREALLYKDTQNHMSNEWSKYQIDSSVAYIENERNSIQQNYKNVDHLSNSFSNIEERFNILADIKGLGENEKAQGLREEFEKAHDSVITTAMNNGDFEYAEEYYETNKEDLDSKYAKDIKKQIEVKKKEFETQKQAAHKAFQSEVAGSFWAKASRGESISIADLQLAKSKDSLTLTEFNALKTSQTTEYKKATPEEQAILKQDVSKAFFSLKEEFGSNQYEIREDASYADISNYRELLHESFKRGAMSSSDYEKRLQFTEKIFQQGPEGDNARSQFKFGKAINQYIDNTFNAFFGGVPTVGLSVNNVMSQIQDKIMDKMISGELTKENLPEMSKELALDALKASDPRAVTLKEMPNSVATGGQLSTVNLAPTGIRADRNLSTQKRTIDDYSEGDIFNFKGRDLQVYIDKETGEKRARAL